MLNRLVNWFRTFAERGTTPEMTEMERKRVWLLHVFYLIATVTYIAAVIETYIVDGPREGHIILVLAILFQVGLVILLSGRILPAEFYLFLITNITLFIFENRHGPDAGVYLFYFPFMTIIAFLVDFRRLTFALFNLILTVCFLIATVMLSYKFLYRPFPAETEETSFRFNLILSGLMTAVVSFVIIRLSYRQYSEFVSRIEERRKNEEKMKAIIREKEILLAEIHHRVKNNLAVISSLLNLQMNTVTNEYTRNVLRESRNRVASMALIHQKLYRNLNVDEIDFRSYATDLFEEIRHSYYESASENIEVDVEGEPVKLSLTAAVPCGLILNELLSNCYKHAFPGNRSGKISIRFGKSKEKPETLWIQLEDDGIGLPPDFDIKQLNSLGLTIIQSLSEQLDAKWELVSGRESGTRFYMQFPVHPERVREQA
ncbi:MAG TPA: sensor histidine kinase [Bacteroidia bacterium]|nr:sensor histidine kinase [Bacteroidia bacterium]